VSALLTAALAALALLVAPASHVPATAASAHGYWIVLGSDRDGQERAYSVRPDGSRLTLLLAPTTANTEPTAVSRDGRTVVYQDRYAEGIYVSRASGVGLRKLSARGTGPVLSRDGRLVAYQDRGIWIVGTNGRGRRRLGSATSDRPADWSPAGDALLVATGGRKPALWVQPLRGRRRPLARGNGDVAEWSPNGRWIAYSVGVALWSLQPNGSHRHRLGGGAVAAAWSPDGGSLAFSQGKDIVVVGATGRRLRRIHVRGDTFLKGVTWSPDGRRLAFESESDEGSQVNVVGVDGRGLRRITSLGYNTVAGWTGLAPVRPPGPPLLPSERAVGDDAVAARRPILDLSADGPRAAFVVGPTAADCSHVVVWTPATRALDRFRPPAPCERSSGEREYGVELAGSRAAWVHQSYCGTTCTATIETATLADRSPQRLTIDSVESSSELDYHMRGDGDLLVFDDGSRLVRIGAGGERCQNRVDPLASICTTLRQGAHAAAVDSVSGSLIAVREPDAVTVLDERGTLVRSFPFGRGEVTAARLDGGRLVVARSGVLDVYDAATGAAESQRPLPSGFALVDADGGIAVLKRDPTIMLLRLGDGRSFTFAPGRAPVFADLERPGLYSSYTAGDGGGRVVFVPRSEVERRLDGSVR
jgi:Tol biopolymer transport system component